MSIFFYKNNLNFNSKNIFPNYRHITMDTSKVLNWLKDFKCTWLSQHILNDTRLIELISNKLHELEQLLIQDNQNENEIFIETENQSANSCDTEPIILSPEQSSLSTPPDIHIPINDEKKRKILSTSYSFKTYFIS